MKSLSNSPRRRTGGFSLVELMIVVAIVAVLTLLTWQGYGVYVRKGEAAACVGKMVNFGAALQTYVSEKQTWPHEDVLNDASGRPPDENVLWDWWYTQMKEYGIDHDDWFCPTDLRLREKEKKVDEAEGKNDTGFQGKLKNPSYIPGKFDFGFYAPFENPNQPWLVERIGHEDFMNKLMPDGTVQKELNFKAVRGMGAGGTKK
jgi:prepilin-type N-terminal cleavage/methylation domain-containing protein